MKITNSAARKAELSQFADLQIYSTTGSHGGGENKMLIGTKVPSPTGNSTHPPTPEIFQFSSLSSQY